MPSSIGLFGYIFLFLSTDAFVGVMNTQSAVTAPCHLYYTNAKLDSEGKEYLKDEIYERKVTQY